MPTVVPCTPCLWATGRCSRAARPASATGYFFKLYRVLEEGPNPDLEMGTFLAERGFAHVPRVLGSLEVGRGRGAPATLAMVQAFVVHESTLWEMMREAVVGFLHDVEAEGGGARL